MSNVADASLLLHDLLSLGSAEESSTFTHRRMFTSRYSVIGMNTRVLLDGFPVSALQLLLVPLM